MKKNAVNILLILVFLIGLSLLLYPSVSDYWNSLHQTRAMTLYTDEVAKISREEADRLWKQAEDFNASIRQRSVVYTLSDEEMEEYHRCLSLDNSGIMGYIEIPSLEISLPIYHGTSESVLKSGIGHLDWTSLPVGGAGTHCVISGHRGLPSAKLFTNLDKLSEGDLFMMRVLDEVLTYEVDQIRIVEPDQIDDLHIVDGMDYCTLVTCTPYGVNSHRMLVRGHRIDNVAQSRKIRITSDAVQVEPILIAPIIAAPILLILLILLMLPSRKRKEPEHIFEGADEDTEKNPSGKAE